MNALAGRAWQRGDMEFEVLMTGIGGQGIQLIGRALALAATEEGRFVLLSPDIGGSMRGGRSQATVVVGDGPLRALPVIARSASAIAMHHQYWEPVAERLRPHATVLINSS